MIISIKTSIILSVVVLALLSFGIFRVESNRNAELHHLYRSAFFGDKDALARLASFNSHRANDLLKDLLINDQSLADAKMTMFALRHHGVLSDAETAKMLDIHGAPGPRHAAAVAFQRDGCMTDCIRAALAELRALQSGEKTLEEQRLLASAFISEVVQSARQIAEQARLQTENEAMSLIKSNPCEAARQLSATENSNDFANMVKAKLTLTENCNN